MLEHLLHQVQQGAQHCNVETGIEYESVQEMQETAKSFGCTAVVNCTGLGSRELCQDDEVVGARGILLNFDRKAVVRRQAVMEGTYGDNLHDAVICTDDAPWGTETEPCYLIPRGDRIVVGGSYLEGDAEESIRHAERERLMQNAVKLGIDIEKSGVATEWTGFRPFRTAVRCEMDSNVMEDEPTVIHSYGYGGSGWTLNVGAAKEVANMLLGPK
jgi:D-amino-acid oxidase